MTPEQEKIVDDLFLEHFGVKGMKWGVTRSKMQRGKASQLRKKGAAFDTAASKARGGTRAHSLRSKAEKSHKRASALERSADKRDAKRSKTKEKGAEAVTTVIKKDARLSRNAPHKKQTRIIAKGGRRLDADTDAIRVEQHKRKLKKSGAAAMSTKELRELTDRLRLEEQAYALTSSRGQKRVKKAFGSEVKKRAKAAQAAKKAGGAAAALA